MKRPFRFFYWRSKVDRLWYWHVRARNGRIVASGAEGYNRRGGLLKIYWKLFAGPSIASPEPLK